MKQLALVEKRVDEDHVSVRVLRQSACGHDCASCGGVCGAARELSAVARDPLGVQPGEWVTVESSSGAMLGLSAILSLIPLVSFFLFYFVSTAIWESAAAQTLFSGLGFAVGLLAPICLSRRMKGKITLTVCAKGSGG